MKQKCKLHSRQNIYDRVVSSLETIIYYHNLYSWPKKKTTCRKTGTLNTPQLCTCSSPLPFPNMGTSSSSSHLGQQLLSAHLPFPRVEVGMGQS